MTSSSKREKLKKNGTPAVKDGESEIVIKVNNK
jgi:hypothetical protein